MLNNSELLLMILRLWHKIIIINLLARKTYIEVIFFSLNNNYIIERRKIKIVAVQDNEEVGHMNKCIDKPL